MIKIKDDGKVLTNVKVELLDLKKPFFNVKSLKVAKKTKNDVIRKPSDTLQADRLKTYHCMIDDDKFGNLFRRYNYFYKCHSLYESSTTKLSKVPKVRKFEELLDLERTSKSYENFWWYLNRVLNLIISTHNFSLILSDIPLNINSSVKVETLNCNLKNPEGVPESTWESWIAKKLLDYYGEMPLCNLNRIAHCCDFDKTTDLDLSLLGSHKYIITLSGTNPYFPFYLSQYIYRKYPDKEILPLILFSIKSN